MRVPGMLETLCDGAQDRSAPELLAAVLRARPRAAGASVRTVFERPVAPASPSRHAGTGERSRATSWLHRPSRRYSAISLARGPSAPCTRLSRSPWGHRRHRRSQSAPAGAAAGATAPAPPRCSGSAEPQLSAFCQRGRCSAAIAPGGAGSTVRVPAYNPHTQKIHWTAVPASLGPPLSLGRVSVASAVSATRASAQATRGGGAAGQLGAPQLACARNHST